MHVDFAGVEREWFCCHASWYNVIIRTSAYKPELNTIECMNGFCIFITCCFCFVFFPASQILAKTWLSGTGVKQIL